MAYFSGEKKGEVHDLKLQLRSVAMDRDRITRRDVLQRVIASMTMGLDLSSLFSDMIMLAHSDDLVQKKMVYLYITEYAATDPQISVLAVNTLQNDCKDMSPVVRGLALRTLSSLRVGTTSEYLLPLLAKGLEDHSPYVRRAAVIGILKFYRTKPNAVRGSSLVSSLHNMLKDEDPIVVADALLTLDAILTKEGADEMVVGHALAINLLNRLQEFSDWHRCVVLDMLSRYYRPESDDEMYDVMNLLESHLQSLNVGVMLAAIKVMISLTESKPKVQHQVFVHIRPNLITELISSPLEVLYVILSHIKLIVSREPQIFSEDHIYFYVRMNEPDPVRALKLEILTKIACRENAEDILKEVSEYARDRYSTVFGSKAVHTIASVGLQVPESVDIVVSILSNILSPKYAVLFRSPDIQAQAIVALTDLLRRYKNSAPKIVSLVKDVGSRVANADDDDYRSKTVRIAIVWLMGEFAGDVAEAPAVFENLCEHFETDSVEERLEMLSSGMKLFFQRPAEMQEVIGGLLKTAIEDLTDDIVTRDRALLYYRLLQEDPKFAEKVVLSGKDKLLDAGFAEEENLVGIDKLFDEFDTLSVCFDMPSERFLKEVEPEEELSEDGEEEDLVADGDPQVEEEDDEVEEIPECPFVEDADVQAGEFQTKWSSLPFACKLEGDIDPNTAGSEIERLLADRYIYCIASGSVDGQIKSFHFAKQKLSESPGDILSFDDKASTPSEVLHLLELVVVSNGHYEATVKSSDSNHESLQSLLAREFDIALDSILKQ